MATQDELKRIAAEKAVEFVPENEYIGIGTGSTINFFIEALGKSGKKIKGAVSTSKKSSELLAKYEIPEVSLNEVMGLAVYVDGADEVNHALQINLFVLPMKANMFPVWVNSHCRWKWLKMPVRWCRANCLPWADSLSCVLVILLSMEIKSLMFMASISIKP